MSDLDLLIEAVEQDDFDAVVAIIERNGQVVGQSDAVGATALHYAAFHGRRRVAQFLVDRGADVNRRDAELGATPAGWAIEYLRELGGHLAIELSDLAYAIETRDIKWVRRILARFPQLRAAVYRDQVTFRQLAAESCDPEIAELFADDITSATSDSNGRS
jgi:ankyrin repeat protein